MSQDNSNPLGLEATGFLPKEAVEAFEGSEAVFSIVVPLSGNGKKVIMVGSIDTPADIPYKDLKVDPVSAMVSIDEISQKIVEMNEELKDDFGKAWLEKWDQKNSKKKKSSRRKTTSSSSTSTAKAAKEDETKKQDEKDPIEDSKEEKPSQAKEDQDDSEIVAGEVIEDVNYESDKLLDDEDDQEDPDSDETDIGSEEDGDAEDDDDGEGVSEEVDAENEDSSAAEEVGQKDLFSDILF